MMKATTARPQKTLRARQRDLTRRVLFEAAIQLFDEKGYEQTTIDEITRAAGTSRRTFFRYFPSKEEVVISQISGMRTFMLHVLKEKAEPEKRPEANLYLAFRTAFIHFRINRGITRSFCRFIRQTPSIHGALLFKREQEAVDIAGLLQTIYPHMSLAEAHLVTAISFVTAETAVKEWIEAEDGQEDELVEHLDRSFQRLQMIFAPEK